MLLFTNFSKAWKTVFLKKDAYISLALSIGGIFVFLMLLPVLIIPGNSIRYQLSSMPRLDILVLLVLSILSGTTAIFNIYIYRQKKHLQKTQIGSATLTGSTTIVTSVLTTATCFACVSTLTGFLGLFTVSYILKYRIILASISVFFMLLSVYFTAQRVLHVCSRCKI